MVERLLLIVNQASGTGCDASLPARLLRELRSTAPGVGELELALVADHPSTRLAARAFLAGSDRPAAMIVGGGGGTLRAAVEGVADHAGGALPGADRVVLGALRMGSGNVIARRLGVPKDPIAGIRALGAALEAGRSEPCPVIRCQFGTRSGPDDVRHAMTMCGLGQWGRCSGDLARWHRCAGRARDLLGGVAGLERVTQLEYVVAAGLRLAQATVWPAGCERVELTFAGRTEHFRLLAGAVLAGPVAGLPFDPRIGEGEVAAGALIVPVAGRPRRLRLSSDGAMHLRLLDRRTVEFFLDEDPEIAFDEVTVDVAGALAFLPGGSLEVAA